MFDKLRKTQKYGPYSIINILQNLNLNNLEILEEFIRNCEINK